MGLQAAVLDGDAPRIAAESRVANVVVRHVGVFKSVAVSFPDVAGGASEADVAAVGPLALVVGASLAVLALVAVVGGVVPGGAAEVVVGVLGEC